MKRSELRRISPLRRGRPIKTGRPAGRARPDEPIAPWCEAQIQSVCTLTADHRHHKLRRSQGGADDPDNTIDLCHACHAFTHENPAWAYESGLLRRSAS